MTLVISIWLHLTPRVQCEVNVNPQTLELGDIIHVHLKSQVNVAIIVNTGRIKCLDEPLNNYVVDALLVAKFERVNRK